MKESLKRLVPLALAAVLAACAQAPTRTTATPAPDSGDYAADVVYHALAGDIAAHRGQLDDAFSHFVWLARKTHDVDAAEKAARIGLHLGKNGETLDAAALWASLAPSDPGALEVKAALYLREGLADEAFEALNAIVELAGSDGREGFLDAAGVVTGSENPELGRELMARLVSEYRGVAEARYAHALVLSAYGLFSEAAEEARAAVTLKPGNELAWLLLSRIRLQQDRVEASGAVLEEAVQRNPGSRVLRVAYARWLVERNLNEQALREFQRLLRDSPNDPDVLFSVGALATELERWDDASRYWKRFLTLGERKDEARYFLAGVEYARGNPEGALALYEQVRDGPLVMEAAVRSAEIYAERGDMASARRLFVEQRVLHPERAATLYLMEAELLRDQERNAEATQVYDNAVEAFPGDADLLYARAMHAASMDRLDMLERDLRAILASEPDHADALNALGYTLADQTDRYEEALALISRALELKPENAAILDSMGWVHYRLGNLEAALAYLRRAAAKDFDSEIAAHLGEVLWVTGNQAEAMRVWQDALERDAGSSLVREAMQRLQTDQ